MAVVAFIANRLSLVLLGLREAQRWWSWKLTSQLVLWLRLIFGERVEKWRSPRARCRWKTFWTFAKTFWSRQTRFNQIFCSSRKDSSYRKCSIALFIVASMSAWFENRCLSLPPYRIPHQCNNWYANSSQPRCSSLRRFRSCSTLHLPTWMLGLHEITCKGLVFSRMLVWSGYNLSYSRKPCFFFPSTAIQK